MSKILAHRPEGRRVDTGAATIYAAKERKVSAWRIGLEMLRLSYGKCALSPEEYFLHGAWKPGLTWRERQAFIGSSVNHALNISLNPPMDAAERHLTANKLACAALLGAAGLPQPRVLAVASETRPDGTHRWLGGPDATLDFLREPGRLPCFGKPVSSSLGLGAVSLLGLDEADEVRLGSGRKVSLNDLVREIWSEFPSGFLFQEIVRPHPDLAALIGPVIGTLRVVTIDAGGGPEPLYAMLRAPVAGAIVDSAAGPLGCNAAVDINSGAILRLQDRRQMGGLDLVRFPETGAEVARAQLPDFPEARRLSVLAHQLVGKRGILGMDVHLSDRGPLLNEVNSNPFHSSYQSAFSRGFLNADFLPQLRAVRARFRDVTPRPKQCPLD